MSAVDSPAGGPDVEDVPGAAPFGVSLAEAMDAHGPLCVGIDPHRTLLESWGLPDTPQGLREFALRTVDALGGRVAAVKPQSAFFERHGGAGVTVLEEVLAALRDIGTMSILDVKRGDIGSTMGGYAQAYLLDEAITVSPYLGYGSLKPALDLADAAGRGVFVLALTSNPEGAGIQRARMGEGLRSRSVAADIVAGATRSNAAARAAGALGNVGLVVGATIGGAVTELDIDLLGANAPLLAPGVGAQGAGATELRAVFGAARRHVLASTSRGVLNAGPDPAALRAAARTAAAQASLALRG